MHTLVFPVSPIADIISSDHGYIPSSTNNSFFILNLIMIFPLPSVKEKGRYTIHSLHYFLPYAHRFTHYYDVISSINSHPNSKSVSDDILHSSWG